MNSKVLFCAAVMIGTLAMCATSGATAAQGQSQALDIPGGEAEADGPLRVVYFYSKTCGHCAESLKALADSEGRWGPAVRVERIESLSAMIVYEDRYGSEEGSQPKVFIGGQYIAGDEKIAERLDAVIREELAAGAVTFRPPGRPADSQPAAEGEENKGDALLHERFAQFGVPAVFLAGLVDGVNPCAFTTIVFLLSMLAYLGVSRRDLAVVGIGFTVAVFGTYFLLGLGILLVIKEFSVASGLYKVVTYAVAALTAALAVWSFVDFVRYTRSGGDTSTATLGLPKSVRRRINKVIRTGLKTRGLLAGSLVVGALVSLLESICTGQVYLPTIMYMAKQPGVRTQAVAYLLLYNAAFIAPLVVILVVAYLGADSQKIGAFLRRHLGWFKLALSGVFAALAVLLIVTL